MNLKTGCEIYLHGCRVIVSEVEGNKIKVIFDNSLDRKMFYELMILCIRERYFKVIKIYQTEMTLISIRYNMPPKSNISVKAQPKNQDHLPVIDWDDDEDYESGVRPLI